VRQREHLRELYRILPLAFGEAIGLRCASIGEEHLLLALVHPSEVGPAATALRSCGVTYEALRDEVARMYGVSDVPPQEVDREAGLILSTSGRALLARAEGLGLGLGDSVPREEHVLMAYLWDSRDEQLLSRCGTSRAEVYEQLKAQGVTVPAVPPPPTRIPPSGRFQQVDVPPERLPEVRSALLSLLSDDSDWGWNVDSANDRAWVVAIGDDLDLEELVGDILSRPARR
jgi:hypothetical protein